MKTKEFIKIMEDAGLCADVTDTNIRIRKEDESAYWTLAIVSKEKQFRLGTESNAFDRQSLETKACILDNLYRYASTPIAARTVIELNKYERLILESLHRDYRTLSINSIGFIHVSDESFKHRNLDMFEELFQWVEEGKTYLIKDLLND